MQRTTGSKRKATFPGLNGGGFPIMSRWLTFLADAGEIPARSGAVDVAFSCSRSTARISEYRRRRNRNKHTAKIYRRVSNFHGVENLRFSEAISVRIAYPNREVTRVRHCNDRNASTDARNLDEQFASLRVLTDQAKLSLLSYPQWDVKRAVADVVRATGGRQRGAGEAVRRHAAPRI